MLPGASDLNSIYLSICGHCFSLFHLKKNVLQMHLNAKSMCLKLRYTNVRETWGNVQLLLIIHCSFIFSIRFIPFNHLFTDNNRFISIRGVFFSSFQVTHSSKIQFTYTVLINIYIVLCTMNISMYAIINDYNEYSILVQLMIMQFWINECMTH